MNELIEIFESWNDTHVDTLEVKEAWGKMGIILSKNLSDEFIEELITYILEYSRLLEKQAFTSGYGKCFSLLLELYKKS